MGDSHTCLLRVIQTLELNVLPTTDVQDWLRGRDLNPRPSGYECFYLVAVQLLVFRITLICAGLFRSSMGDRFG